MPDTSERWKHVSVDQIRIGDVLNIDHDLLENDYVLVAQASQKAFLLQFEDKTKASNCVGEVWVPKSLITGRGGSTMIAAVTDTTKGSKLVDYWQVSIADWWVPKFSFRRVQNWP